MRKHILALIAGLCLVGPASAQELTEETFAKWHALILPKEKDVQWREIGWQPSFWHAVVAAHKQDKPILLWSMHGHPFSET